MNTALAYFFGSINSSPIYLCFFVLCLVVLKYGVLGFVLSKTVKSLFKREKIDALFTICILVALFGLNRNTPLHITHSHVAINLLYTLLAVVLYYAINIVVGEKLGEEKPENQQRMEKMTREIPFGLSLLATGLLAPLFEEVIFRFYIQDQIFGNTVAGLLISSLLFALMHLVSGFSISGLLTYTGTSIVVGVLYMLSGGLLFSAIMHVTVNSLAVVFMYHGHKLKTFHSHDSLNNKKR